VGFIAIKRLKPEPWFSSDRQSRVRGLLLDKIKAHYDYWTIWQIAKQVWFGVQEKISSRESAVKSFRDKDWTPPNEFICSGLVQIGFVEMMVEAIKNNQISPEALRDVVFTRSAEKYLPPRGLWANLGDQQKETAQITRAIMDERNREESGAPEMVTVARKNGAGDAPELNTVRSEASRKSQNGHG